MKRINLFLGHYGSGKTNVATNFAIFAKNTTKSAVTVYDMDIVNPYFRTLDAKKTFDANGIQLIASDFANTNVDIPAINARANIITDVNSGIAICDIGGDDRGAMALGRFREKILEENNYDAFMVINRFRPETRDKFGVEIIKNEIEEACKIKITGLINNSNLGVETTKETILSSIEFGKDVASYLNIPLMYTSMESKLAKELNGNIDNILSLNLIDYGNF